MESNLKVFKSDRFDVEDTASLSLFLYSDSLFIFAKDKNQSNICIHEYMNFDWDSLEQLVISDHLLKRDIPAKVYLHHSDFSLVPGVLYQPGKEASYLAFAGEPKVNASYFNTPLDSNNLQVLSCVEGKLKKALEARFSDLTFHHGSVSFLSYLFKERFNLIGQEILVSIFGNHIYAAAFSNQELAAFNLFTIDTKDDILKYVMIFIEQLKFDRNHVRISLFGATDKSGISENWGKEYFHNFRLLSSHANQNFTHGFKHLKSVNLFETNWQFD
ncbi:uncharacterized protein DUF3822 [Algoriphagus ratkowskyi]|uniref:Uncharacterized protein DUF3822 n=1 Tax=Algoriphagus ratkowskyi TaxID=57028 RepID=A0A2W7QN83_9BACT|nr:DUF3822 family protein [Algoriphagus ratkowskyi]PZX49561.1 uncharacterized protein DUF3822 [Algoriphagus ratkowskyi]